MTFEPEFGPIRLHRDEGNRTPAALPGCPIRRSNGEGAEWAVRLAGLIGAVASGDRDAFTEFYRETSDRVYGLATRVLRSRSAAEEVTQEVYLQVWSIADRYDPQLSSPIGWLMMLTHRRAVDRVRSQQSAIERDIVYGHAHLGRDHDIVAEEVGQHLEEQSVLDCLTTLTAIQREAVALAYYSGRTYREVADQLEVPLSTVKARIRNGLKRLQTCLTESEPR
ncbi:ECF RNA polymerase sigma factor SigK [Nocardia australiensis]|uniref:ECF RNA polymerase sigma factor SigK n=1 Tax=Nocardia australiensis TaxID=2887191 RepID=UPI001D1583A5|nr:ECF RNA polymerase sigma factor SigK [Nocardia australiensis]